MGTPSVGYDAPGVRDSIAEPRLLAPIGDVEALASRLEALHADPGLYEELRRAAWERSRLHSREAATEAFAAALLGREGGAGAKGTPVGRATAA